MATNSAQIAKTGKFGDLQNRLVFLLLALVTALGVGLWLAAMNVQFRDVHYTIPFLVQALLLAIHPDPRPGRRASPSAADRCRSPHNERTNHAKSPHHPGFPRHL